MCEILRCDQIRLQNLPTSSDAYTEIIGIALDALKVDTDIPTVGFSFTTFAQVGGVPQNILTQWSEMGHLDDRDLDDVSQRLILPSGKRTRY
jgi:hypothetical protein